MDNHYREKVLETELNKYQLMPFIREKVAGIEVPFEEWSEEAKIAKDILAYLLFYKRTSPSVLIGLLHKRFPDIDTCIEVLDHLIDQDYLDYTENHQVVTKLCLPKDEEEKLQKMMYPQPMLVPPLKLKRNTDSGYWYAARCCLILRSRYFAEDINLDHLNRVNQIPLQINKAVLHNRLNKPKKDLPTVQDRTNWERFVTQQHDIALSYENDTFYLTHKYDKRGRVYCQGYHISYQSNDYTNALVEFAHGETCI